MRFDIEFNIVDTLSSTGLTNLSSYIYTGNNITPANWDNMSLFNKASSNSGSLNTSGYNNKKFIDSINISSGFTNLSNPDLLQIDNIDNQGFVTPIFNGGNYYSNSSNFKWSKNSIVGDITQQQGVYSFQLDSNIDPLNIEVSTLYLTNRLSYQHKKEYTYIAYNTSLDKTFSFNTKDYKFTILNDVVYLNTNLISYTSQQLFPVTGNSRMFILPEFPAKNVIVQGLTSGVDYNYNSGIIITTVDRVSLTVSFTVDPIITYINTNRSGRDTVFSNINMHPKLLNYKNGTLCVQPNFNNIEYPANLVLTSDKDTVFGPEIAKISILLNGISGIAIGNKDITLTTDNGIFPDSNSNKVTVKTLSSGTATTSLISKADRLGVYIQKNWISGNTITLPFNLPNIDPSLSYLHFVTADDPILGSKYGGSDTAFSDSYTSNTLQSYVMNGRKIAYVSMQDDNGTIRSRFIKPISITYNSNNTSPISIKDLQCNILVGSTTVTGLMHTVLVGSAPSSGYYNYIPQNTTTITFSNNLPIGSNVAGLWLITDTKMKINATYSENGVTVNSNDLYVNIQNVKSENAFTLNKYDSLSPKTQLGSFGYYTISEYLKNPYGLTAFSYYCTYSDCIYKKCTYQDPTIHPNFILDSGGIGCAHNTEYDTLYGVTPCPKQDAHLVNPFIMNTATI